MGNDRFGCPVNHSLHTMGKTAANRDERCASWHNGLIHFDLPDDYQLDNLMMKTVSKNSKIGQANGAPFNIINTNPISLLIVQQRPADEWQQLTTSRWTPTLSFQCFNVPSLGISIILDRGKCKKRRNKWASERSRKWEAKREGEEDWRETKGEWGKPRRAEWSTTVLTSSFPVLPCFSCWCIFFLSR